MLLPYKILAIVILAAGCFVAGRFTVQKNSDLTIDKNKVSDVHTQTTTTTTKNKDGSITIVKTQDKTSETKTQEEVKKEIKVVVSSKVSIAALVVVDTANYKRGVVYGLHVQKQVLGPINLGAFGLTNGVIGLSAGVSF